MNNTAQAYNDLTPHYHLIFQDWHSAIKRQAGIISRFLPSPQEAGPVRHPRACGIGTQALGLAALGYEVEGTDISPSAVERAQRELVSLGLNASFRVDNMRTLTTSP